jgi:hypothetical protein
MKYLQDIRAGHNDPKQLEDVYQAARQAKEADEFKSDLLAGYQESPDNVLYAAWYYRLQVAQPDQAEGRSINWKLAIPLSVVMGLILWGLSFAYLKYTNDMVYLGLLWALVGACFVIAFLAIGAGRHQKRAWLAMAGMAAIGVYALLFIVLFRREQYQALMILHLPLLAWIGVGVSLLELKSDAQNRFAFLIKSLEVFVTGGIFMIAGGAFSGITVGMFEALGVHIPDAVMRLLLAGGGGLIPVLAVASVYDPHARPIGQKFEQGLGKLISTLMRLLLPLTLLVLVVYLFVIPFNFMEPFRNRDVLIIYNVMLFAIMGLLVGATPVREDDLAPGQQALLRKGILAVALLAAVVSLYALSATVYRTVLGGVTVNRLTIVGWNGINIGLLSWLIARQLKDGSTAWVRSLQSVFSVGITAYVVWTLFLILAVPLIFSY